MNKNMPHIVSWSINRGNNDIRDYFTLEPTYKAAREAMDKIIDKEDNLHCWAISQPVSVSEPHWMEQGGC